MNRYIVRESNSVKFRFASLLNKIDSEKNLLMRAQILFLLMRHSLFYFSGAGKFCLAHVLRQLTRDTTSDVSFFTNILYVP